MKANSSRITTLSIKRRRGKNEKCIFCKRRAFFCIVFPGREWYIDFGKKGVVFAVMAEFEKIADEVYLLKIPFGPVWTGVILIDGEKKILIDSGATGKDVDGILVPALEKRGLGVRDLDVLTCTHTHGDHVGGHKRLEELGVSCIAAFEGSVKKLHDPVFWAVKTRTRFPEYSPAPNTSLSPVRVDRSLKDGDILGGRLRLIHTPGHDDDCVCFLDEKTGVLFTGDSLQGNGTICQGVAFYKDLPAYERSLICLKPLAVSAILCGHDYAGIGALIRGKEAVQNALAYCEERVKIYREFIQKRKEKDPAALAEELIEKEGCGMPDKLFMALYTVTEHLKELEKETKING